jgi:hypothetical protein
MGGAMDNKDNNLVPSRTHWSYVGSFEQTRCQHFLAAQIDVLFSSSG